MKTNKLLLSALALGVMTPAIVAPIATDAITTSKTFKDVPTAHPYYNIISEMTEQGIISGYEDGTFKPNETINRQHAALLINNAVDLPEVNEVKSFKDVTTKHPYYQAIQNLQKAGLIQPDSKGNFNPTKKLTRGEMAKIIATAYDLEVKADYTFKDIEGTEYEDYIKALYSNKVTAGYEDDTFRPNEPLTRAHYAVFMNRAKNFDPNYVAKPIEENPTTPPFTPSLDLSDYPSDKLLTKGISNYKEMALPNGKKPSAETITEILNVQKEKALELSYKNKVTAKSGGAFYGDDETSEIVIKNIARDINKTVPETIQIINYTYGTGEVYDGETFYLYFEYGYNGVTYAYRK